MFGPAPVGRPMRRQFSPRYDLTTYSQSFMRSRQAIKPADCLFHSRQPPHSKPESIMYLPQIQALVTHLKMIAGKPQTFPQTPDTLVHCLQQLLDHSAMIEKHIIYISSGRRPILKYLTYCN